MCTRRTCTRDKFILKEKQAYPVTVRLLATNLRDRVTDILYKPHEPGTTECRRVCGLGQLQTMRSQVLMPGNVKGWYHPHSQDEWSHLGMRMGRDLHRKDSPGTL